MNIVTGQIAHPDGNADDAVSLGQRAMSNFLAGWPRSFYDPLGKLVVTMDVMKKHMSVGKKRVYDQELIDARLLANSREINTDNFDVLAYELPAYPPSMFNPGSEMKITKSKSTLKLQVVISERNCPIPETLICDVSALLWVLTWPPDKLHVYVDAFLLFVHQALQRSNVTLVFDRYFPNSTKNFTRMQRARLNRVYRLTPGDACSSQTSHSHQYKEQYSTECHACRRSAQLRLLHACNTEAYSHDCCCCCQRRANGDS